MAQIIRNLIKNIRNLFYIHKHHAIYDDKWCQWYCSKCGDQLYEEDFPSRIWRYLERKTERRSRRH